MSRLQWWTVVLIVQLAVFYNIERLSFGQESLVDISGFSYVLVLVAVVAIIVVPIFRGIPGYSSLAIWIVVYFMGQALLPSERPLLGGVHTYLLITEVFMLSIAVLLAHQVAGALQEFAEAVEQVTLPDVERWVVQIEDAADEIRTEIDRSRRYQRPLSVLVVKPAPGTVSVVLQRLVQEVQQVIARHYAVVNLGRLLKISLRRTDLITLENRGRGRFIVLCPETDAAGAATLVERIKEFARQELGFPVVCGTAFFPDDALTFDEVVRQATSRIPESTEHDSSSA